MNVNQLCPRPLTGSLRSVRENVGGEFHVPYTGKVTELLKEQDFLKKYDSADMQKESTERANDYEKDANEERSSELFE